MSRRPPASPHILDPIEEPRPDALETLSYLKAAFESDWRRFFVLEFADGLVPFDPEHPPHG